MALASSLAQQIAQADFEGGGDAGKGIHGNRFLHALHFAYVFGIEVRQFAQSLLRQLRLLAVMTGTSPGHSGTPW